MNTVVDSTDPLEAVIEETKSILAKEREEQKREGEEHIAKMLQVREIVVTLLQQANEHLKTALGSPAFLKVLELQRLAALFSFSPDDPNRLDGVIRLLNAEIPAERKGVWVCLAHHKKTGYALEIFEEDTSKGILQEYPADGFEYLPQAIKGEIAELSHSPKHIAVLVTRATIR